MDIRRAAVLAVLVTTPTASLAHCPAAASDSPDAQTAVVAAADAAAPPSPDGLVRRSFSNADGARDYLLARPPGGQPVPLIVFLHGCGAAPVNYGLHDAAAAYGVAVAYPVQSVAANPDGCWNWRSRAGQYRGAGEPSIIAGITSEIVDQDGIDSTRVFIAGHSAGSGMTAIMAAAYPDIYAAAGLLAGCGGLTCADVTGLSAYRAMGPRARPIPAYIGWGTKDALNPYLTGRIQLLQWLAMNDLADDGLPNLSMPRIPASIRYLPANAGPDASVESYHDRRGCDDVSFTSVIGGGHIMDFASPPVFPSMIAYLLAHPKRADCRP